MVNALLKYDKMLIIKRYFTKKKQKKHTHTHKQGVHPHTGILLSLYPNLFPSRHTRAHWQRLIVLLLLTLFFSLSN